MANSTVLSTLAIGCLLSAIGVAQASNGNGLAGYWPFDDGVNPTADQVGANNGALVNGPNFVPGAPAVPGNISALDFNGSDQYVQIDTSGNSALDFADEFTVSVWVNLDVLDDGHIVSKDDQSGGFNTNTRSWALFINEVANRFGFTVTGNAGSVGTRRESLSAPPVGTYVHVAGVFDGPGSRMDIYVNGIKDNGSLSGSPTIPPNTNVNNTPVTVGALYKGLSGTPSVFLDGKVDDVRLYNRALSDAEVAFLANPVFYSCVGFQAPMDKVVRVRKNRALPHKAEMLDEFGIIVTDANVAAPPVIQVLYESGTSPAVDVTDDALSPGNRTEGNEMFYDATKQEWRYNLYTRNYSAAGTYTVTVASGDETEYQVAPTCESAFVVNN